MAVSEDLHNNISAAMRFTIVRFTDLLLWRKTPDFDENFVVEKLKDAPVDFSRIRCPLCRWQPNKSSRWCCSDDAFHRGCFTSWNTFETRGLCPGCHYQWRLTDCLRCFKSSPHEAWYENED